MLIAQDLFTNYGPICALNGVTLEVQAGEIVTLIGANGAGKTTLLKTVMNLVKPQKGQVLFLDEDVRGLPTETIVRKGIIMVQEGRAILNRMTVKENLLMGAYVYSDKAEIKAEMEQVFRRFPVLKKRQGQMAGSLSGGEQQMLAIGRALMARPRLLMLDEPSLGLAPILVNKIFDIIGQLHQAGRTILLVEQNAKKALQVSNRAYVLELGKVALKGLSSDMLLSDEVKTSYLGGG
ncbi:MAG: ABC transporter ATP-binding protein [Deltaproteobacteria bacterium]|nr:ABC transporter ATP-binding protein [Deltaproteobacteria bacterium]